MRAPVRSGWEAPGLRARGRVPGPRAGPERARRALPVRQGEPGPWSAGGGPRASGAGPGIGPGAQRRDERARPDPFAAARYRGRDQALHQRRPGHAGGAHLQQEHRRGAAAHGVQDDLRVHAARADPDLDSRGHPPGPAAVRDRARHDGGTHRGLLRLDRDADATRGAPAGTPDAAGSPGRGGAGPGVGRGGGGVRPGRVRSGGRPDRGAAGRGGDHGGGEAGRLRRAPWGGT
jgi:translation initiation factor IF-2